MIKTQEPGAASEPVVTEEKQVNVAAIVVPILLVTIGLIMLCSCLIGVSVLLLVTSTTTATSIFLLRRKRVQGATNPIAADKSSNERSKTAMTLDTDHNVTE